MITTIGFLVQETSHRIRGFFATSLYTIACLITSSLLGALLSSIGQSIHSISCHAFFCSSISSMDTTFLGIIAGAYAVSDAGLISLPRPRLMDAVPLTWWHWWKPYGAALAYGAALGLGIMTRVQFGAFYVLCLWCVFKGDVVYGTLLMGTYGATRALTLIPASWCVYRSHSQERVRALLSFLSRAKLIVAIILMLFGTLLLTSSFF